MATELEDLKVLQAAETIADDVWREVLTWGKLAQDVVGKQLARAADSIGANIAESYGRYHYGEKINFLYYARGSLFETKYWLNRCLKRGIFNQQKTASYASQLTNMARQLNTFANSLKSQRRNKQTKRATYEPRPEYFFEEELPLPLFSSEELNWLNQLSLEEPPQSLISSLQSPQGNNHD
jgi:four helix bundle protein